MSRGYPSDWDSRRRQVYERDDYTCQNCGASSHQDESITLHAHHIVPKSKGGSHSLSNLVSLCDDCHSRIHPHMESSPARSQQILRKSQYDSKLISVLSNIDAVAEQLHTQINRCAIPNKGEELFQVYQSYDSLATQLRQTVLEITDTIERIEAGRPEHLSERRVDFDDELTADGLELLSAILSTLEHMRSAYEELVDEYLSCPDCGNTIRPHMRYCNNCGQFLESITVCGRCQTTVDPLDHSCGLCGMRLRVTNTDPLAEAERIERMAQAMVDDWNTLWEQFNTKRNNI